MAAPALLVAPRMQAPVIAINLIVDDVSAHAGGKLAKRMI